MRGIIGVEAMVRHGKKLSEGKEKEGEGEGRCISPVQPDPFSLGLWYDSFRGGIMFIYKCINVLAVFPTPVSKQTLKIKSNRLKGMVNADLMQMFCWTA